MAKKKYNPDAKKEIITIYHEAEAIIRADGTIRDESHLRVAAYARVSTLKEDQENSYDTQVNYFQKLISNNPDWENVGIYTDKGKSGRYEKNRPGLQKLLEDSEAGKIDIILIKSISRFFRNCYKAQEMLQKLTDCDIEVRFIEGDISSKDPSAAMLIQLLTSIAENESRSISENVKWGYNKRAEQGIRHIGSNHVFGYDEIDGVLTPNENAEGIRFAFEAFAGGMSYRDICSQLNKMNVKTLRKQKPFRAKALGELFRNEIYVGDRLLQKSPPTNPNPNTDSRKYKPAYTSKYIKNDHEPIVSRDVWDAVQVKMDRRSALFKLGIKVIEDPHFLLGRVFCEECGAYMRTKLLSINDIEHIVWICPHAIKGKKENRCPNKGVFDSILMKMITDRFGEAAVEHEHKNYDRFSAIDKITVSDEKVKIILTTAQ